MNELNAEAITAILRDRARALAARNLRVPDRMELAQVIVVRRGDALFGLPLDRVAEIRRVEVAPVPHATEAVPGIFQIRGQIHSLVDILPLLDTGNAFIPPENTLAALLSHASGPIGLRLDEVLGLRVVYEDECDLRNFQHAFIRTVTRDMLQLLDVDPLLNHPSLSLDLAD